MKAIAKLKPEPGLWLTSVPEPTAVNPNDVLIRVLKTAICGTDIHIYQWDAWAQKTIPTPMVIGHEFMGEVVEVGSEVTNFKKGDFVSGEGHLTCDECRNCRAGKRHLCRNTRGIGCNIPGAFVEYFAMPAKNVFLIPPGIPHDVAAILDPLGNATHTALSFDCVGEDVLITGAGPIGMMAIPIVRHAGARNIVITDVNDYRLDLAANMGCGVKCVNVLRDDLKQVIKSLKIMEGFDVGLEMSGNMQAFQQMIDVMYHGGKMALLGILPNEGGIDWPAIIFKSLTIKGIYGREMFETWYKMASMLQSGLDVSPVITHHFPADEFQAAFNVMLQGKAGKVILDWA